VGPSHGASPGADLGAADPGLMCVSVGTALGRAKPDAVTMTYINNSHAGSPCPNHH